MTDHLSAPLDTDVALAEAADAFAHWRATRHRGREPTPRALRAMAVALLERHRSTSIARALAINPAALSRWASETGPVTAPDPAAFVTLAPATPPSAAEPPDPSAAELVLRWPHGAQLVVRGPIEPATLEAILAAAMTPPPSAP